MRRRKNLVQTVSGQLGVRFDDDFARRGVDHVGSGQSAVKLGLLHFDCLDAGGAKRLERVAP